MLYLVRSTLSDYLLPATYYLLLLITDRLLPLMTYCLIRTTLHNIYYLLLTACYLMLINYLLINQLRIIPDPRLMA